jgi:hypothetical protein
VTARFIMDGSPQLVKCGHTMPGIWHHHQRGAMEFRAVATAVRESRP